MRPVFERVFGLGWTERLRGWPLLLTAVAALMLSAAAGVPSYPVWPGPDNHDLDRTGSPGVIRNGSQLEFKGAVPWAGRHASGDRAGRRVSFGAAPPDENPAPASWEHYAPEAVILHSPEKGTLSFSPAEFEQKARFGYFLLTFLLDLLITAVFFFVISLLLRFKGVALPAFGPLRVLGRCLVPACVYAGILALFGAKLATDLSIAVFVVVIGMNAILFVLASKPAAAEAPFEV